MKVHKTEKILLVTVNTREALSIIRSLTNQLLADGPRLESRTENDEYFSIEYVEEKDEVVVPPDSRLAPGGHYDITIDNGGKWKILYNCEHRHSGEFISPDNKIIKLCDVGDWRPTTHNIDQEGRFA